ncbi:MAG: TlyA family RNA methyltransferase [Campylobacterales bacterium]|nr:TlyA family RNA methyltransferase [Campylobacterales bacterium]
MTNGTTVTRLDAYLVQNEFCETRNKAQTLIKEGYVLVNDKPILKSAYKVEKQDNIVLKEHKSYVSRAAFKLLEFLKELHLDVTDMKALDIGSSTGGFTQVLLERGVKEVSAVDVGTGQLHNSLREDSRVKVFESCDIRDFATDQTFDIVVSDVAFISLLYILDAVNRLASRDIILLFKPQFEVGREIKRDKNGVVVDKKAIVDAMLRFENACALLGWNLLQKSPSTLTGKEGNLEYCYYFVK